MKKFSRLLYILFIGNSFLFANSIETIQKELTLKDLIDTALSHNVNIEATRFKSEGKKAVIDLTRSSYLPNLNAIVDAGQYGVKTSTVDDNDQAYSATISASQLISDFGKTSGLISSAKKDYLASQKELASNIMNTILSVKESYYNILNQHQLINVAQEAIQIDDLQYEQAQEYFKAGVRTKIDVTNAQLRLSNSNLDLVNAQYDLYSAKTQMIVILGQKLGNKFDVEKENQEIDSLVKRIVFIDKDVEQFISTALKNRAELEMHKALISAQKEKISSINSEYYPKLYVDGTYNNQESDLSTLDTEQWNTKVNLEWNFYTGNSTDASSRENLALLSNLKSQYKQQELTIIQEVTNSYLDVNRSQKSLQIATLNVELSTQNMSLADQRYKSGLNDMIELNDAKLEYTKAKSNLVNTYYEYLTAVANLEYSIGIIHE